MATFVIGVVLGAYVALTVRAIFASFAAERVKRAAEESLTPEHLDRLRAYIAEISAHERERMTLIRDGGSTVITRVK